MHIQKQPFFGKVLVELTVAACNSNKTWKLFIAVNLILVRSWSQLLSRVVTSSNLILFWFRLTQNVPTPDRQESIYILEVFKIFYPITYLKGTKSMTVSFVSTFLVNYKYPLLNFCTLAEDILWIDACPSVRTERITSVTSFSQNLLLSFFRNFVQR